MTETTGDDVIDIWTQREKEKVLAEETRIKYYDIPHNALKNLIRAIKYPIEMRLLPHILREWHRQGFPTTLIDANRIARLATRHNEIDVVFQMIDPEVYGLYYDIEGIREVTRGMAKRASMAQGEGGGEIFTGRHPAASSRFIELLGWNGFNFSTTRSGDNGNSVVGICLSF